MPLPRASVFLPFLPAFSCPSASLIRFPLTGSVGDKEAKRSTPDQWVQLPTEPPVAQTESSNTSDLAKSDKSRPFTPAIKVRPERLDLSFLLFVKLNTFISQYQRNMYLKWPTVITNQAYWCFHLHYFSDWECLIYVLCSCYKTT